MGLLDCMKSGCVGGLGVWEVVGSRLGREIVGTLFSSYPETGKVFSSKVFLYSKIINSEVPSY